MVFDKQLFLEKVPKGVSESKAEIERAVQAIESQSRTLRSALETSYGRKVPDDHPVLTWLVEHASTTYNFVSQIIGSQRWEDTVL